jgi:hypothetical protein
MQVPIFLTSQTLVNNSFGLNGEKSSTVTSLTNSAIFAQPSSFINMLDTTLIGVKDGTGELVGGSVNTPGRDSEELFAELINNGGIGVQEGVGVAKKDTPCNATIVRTASVCSMPGMTEVAGAAVQAANIDMIKTMTIIMVRLRIQILLISCYH